MRDPLSSNQLDLGEDASASARKRRAILAAAEEVFLKGGFLGANMDELAALALVSKQTVYKHFGSKEALFVEVVNSMTGGAGDLVLADVPGLDDIDDVALFLQDYGMRQLSIVLTPRLMQLRRMVIGEVSRFPDLAATLYERGPQRAIDALTAIFEHLARRNILSLDDPAVAAYHYNWLIMAEPVNRAMLLGDESIPDNEEMLTYVKEGVRVFLAAYGLR